MIEKFILEASNFEERSVFTGHKGTLLNGMELQSPPQCWYSTVLYLSDEQLVIASS